MNSEAAFVEDLKNGDADAFDLLITRYSPDIYALLFRLAHDAEEAADLTQETFIRALRSIGKFRGESAIKTWLFRIAVNESRNRFRWSKPRRRDHVVSLDDRLAGSDMLVSDSLSDAGDDPNRFFFGTSKTGSWPRRWCSFPFFFREAVVLYDIEGQSYKEMAEILRVNIGTVKSRIARGRSELRKRLRDF